MVAGTTALYEDPYIVITEEGVELKSYYGPGLSKKVPFKNIKKFSTAAEEKLDIFSFKTWGMGLDNIWWAWGPRSQIEWPNNQFEHLILQTGSWIRKGCTVLDMPRVKEILRQYVSALEPPEKKQD